jgi:pimeloyl-ACP methyl ester carboxylesterase
VEAILSEGNEATWRSVSSDGHRLAWQESGEGETVVLLHSGGLSGRQWRRLAESLARHFRVVVPDLLGYGASGAWEAGAPFDFRQDVAALTRMLEQYDGTIHLVAHSYGGLLAMHLLLAQPQRFGRLALYEPVVVSILDPVEDEEALTLLRQVRLTYEPSTPGGVDELWLEKFVEWWNGAGAWQALTPEVQEAFRRSSWKLHYEVISLISDHTTLESFRALPHRVLLLGGELSPLTERRVLSRLSEALPNSTLRLFPGVGHMGPLTHAALVNEAIEQHLRAP